MHQPIRLAVLGLGWPGFRHAEAMLASETTALVAACDLNPGRRDEFLKTHPEATLYEDYAKMLLHPDLDGVVIGLPNFLHYSTSKQALEAGKHVLCEKPPTMHAGEMSELKTMAEER